MKTLKLQGAAFRLGTFASERKQQVFTALFLADIPALRLSGIVNHAQVGIIDIYLNCMGMLSSSRMSVTFPLTLTLVCITLACHWSSSRGIALVFASPSASTTSTPRQLPVDEWSNRYRNWTYYPTWMIPPTPVGQGIINPQLSDVPSVWEATQQQMQVDGLPRWRMFYIFFNGTGYQYVQPPPLCSICI